MGRAKIDISRADLERLYHAQGLTPGEIGRIYNCNKITIRNRLKEFKIPLKKPALARTRYAKRNFDGSDETKAYIIGFRIGDLNVYIPGVSSETIVARCHSTRKEQIDIIKKLFKKYGQTTISTRKDSPNMQINCFLNKSFSFLVPKYSREIRDFVKSKENVMYAFAAGYIDAEGCFQMNQKKGRFKMDSYDSLVLSDISELLNTATIHHKRRLIAKKGDRRGTQKWNGNLWRIEVNDSVSLEKFIRKLSPYMKHKKRIQDARLVLRDIKRRRKNGTIRK